MPDCVWLGGTEARFADGTDFTGPMPRKCFSSGYSFDANRDYFFICWFAHYSVSLQMPHANLSPSRLTPYLTCDNSLESQLLTLGQGRLLASGAAHC